MATKYKANYRKLNDTELHTWQRYTATGVLTGKGVVASAEPPGVGGEGRGLWVSQKAGVQRSLRRLGHSPSAPGYNPGRFPPVKSPSSFRPESHQQDLMQESPSPQNQSACEPDQTLAPNRMPTRPLDYYVIRKLRYKSLISELTIAVMTARAFRLTQASSVSLSQSHPSSASRLLIDDRKTPFTTGQH